MTALPAATDFTGASITEAQFKTAVTDQRAFLAGLLGSDGTVASALATLGALGSAWVSKTAAYTVAASDRGKLIGCDGTFTLSLTAAATLGDGFSFAVLNYGSGTVTIDPNSSELIDGASTITLEANESCVVMCTGGTAFRAIGRGTSDGQYQSMQVFTASGTWNKPTGLKRVKVTVVGGGGGAGDGTTGGGGGGTAIKTIEASALAANETVTVGAGGAGSTTVGTTGGTSSFGSHCSATGGLSSAGYGGGGGGGGSGGDLNITGGSGTPSAGTDSAWGVGGSSYLGGGGKFPGPSATAGSAGGSYGGGGSSCAAPGTGGSGAAGIVIVEEFF